MIIIDANEKRPIKIGKLGENEARVIRFPVGDILTEFPGAAFSLLNKRSFDPNAYPVPTENYVVDGDYLLWTVTSGDVAQKGEGECEIVASRDGQIVKDVIYRTETERSLDGSENPPDPWQSWVDDVTEAAERAEEAVQELHDMTATAETLEPGEPATASYQDGVLTLGIPKGDKGDQGEQGEQGEPGAETALTGTLISGNKYQMSMERV